MNFTLPALRHVARERRDFAGVSLSTSWTGKKKSALWAGFFVYHFSSLGLISRYSSIRRFVAGEISVGN